MSDVTTMTDQELEELRHDLERDLAADGEDGNGMDVNAMAALMLEEVEAEIQRRHGIACNAL